MTHPLAGNLSTFKDAELEEKIQSLSRKYFQTPNPEVKLQIMNLLNDYKAELYNRRSKAWDQQYQKRDKDLDNLIKVN